MTGGSLEVARNAQGAIFYPQTTKLPPLFCLEDESEWEFLRPLDEFFSSGGL